MTVGSSEIRLLIRRPSDINTAAGLQAFGDSVMSKRHRELAELNLRGSGSSSAWCSAHNVSAAAGRMFEDPGLLRFGSARDPWSLEKQSSRPVYTELINARYQPIFHSLTISSIFLKLHQKSFFAIGSGKIYTRPK